MANTAKKPARKTSVKTKKASKDEFSKGDFVVYPAHGVGKLTGVETQEIAGAELRLFVIDFEQDKMRLRVPVAKAKDSGLRRLSTRKVMDDAMSTLKRRARVKRTMWSRRAQEYEAKINSGDPISIAEVVRDLYRKADQPDQSYSERQMYQAALDRLCRELSAIEKIDEDAATKKVEKVLEAA
jgi:CarD family transcriptional regulator